MCDIVSKALGEVPASSRRKFIQGLSALTAATGLAAVAAPASASPSGRNTGSNNRTRVVLLGTAGGPTILSDHRMGVATAVVYEDKVYVVDLGHGSQMRLIEAGLGAEGFGGTSFANVRGLFFTHMHSDHLIEWPAVYSTASMNTVGRTINGPIEVFGPGDRGSLPRVFPPGRAAPPVYNPDDPTPGITGMSGYLRQAFAADFNDRARDSNFASPDAIFNIQDINISPYWAPDPQGVPPRLAAPLQIWQDGDVTVTATLVDHHPTAPAFAFRFDTPDGSVVISGDTGVSQNLIDLARGCDFLVHEVIDPQFAEQLAATLPPAIAEPVKKHLLESHTTIEQVGRDVAEKAQAKNLVLTHLVPANNPVSRWQQAQKGYSGKLIVGEDLMQLGVGSTRQN
ncbi:MAG: Metal-dependent hydrolase of the beta-lactamase superfamily [Pseudarthrobacter sp.]|nr:Metal-dependent hydrolase of the beta-lactamase superfamily [Pseudarthrobacter sp.]